MNSIVPAIVSLVLSFWISLEGFCAEFQIHSLKISGIENAFQVSKEIYSGSQPKDAVAFAELKKLGVKTIVSVDGVKPDVETARKYELRYVHLPIGYDGVPTNRIAELAQLSRGTNGPFFVHCHHGQHRGPTAVAVMCLASGKWTGNRAEAWLHQAGTSSDYPGLFRAAREFQPPTAIQLSTVNELPEVTPTSSVVDAMVMIDENFNWLKKSKNAGWRPLSGRVDDSPTHHATMLWEQFREMSRSADISKLPQDYRDKLNAAEDCAKNLHELVSKSHSTIEMDAAFQRANESCVACHRKYRNE